MLPDSIPSPKTAEIFEAQLRQLELPEVPGTLDARMQTVLAQAAPATRPPALAWRKWAPACAALAACAVVAMLLRPQTSVEPASATHATVATHSPAPNPEQVAPVGAVLSPVFEGAVPVGYQYQSSRTLYAQETPLGTVNDEAGQPQQAYQRRLLLRHTFENPKTHALYEVDAPKEELILENLQSY